MTHLWNPRRRALIDGPLALMAACIVAGGLAGTPYLLIRPDLVRAGFGAQVGPYGVLALPNPLDFFKLLAFNLWYLVWPTQGGDWYVVPHAAIGLVPGAAAAAGLAAGFRRDRRLQWYLAVFPALDLLFLARANVFYTRNLEPLLPLVAIWAGLGAVWAWERVRALRPRARPAWRIAAAAAGIAVLLGGPVRESAALAAWLHRHRDTRTQAVAWLRGHVPRGATVAFEIELAWYLPDLDRLPFPTVWTDRSTPLSWYGQQHVRYAVVSEWNPVSACPVVRFIRRPRYLPSVEQEALFVPNSYPIIDPTIVIARPQAHCTSVPPAARGRRPTVRVTP
jgi:hypothetical protein